MASGSDSHLRVEPSISVNRKVTVPEGRITPEHYACTPTQDSHRRNPSDMAPTDSLPAPPVARADGIPSPARCPKWRG